MEGVVPFAGITYSRNSRVYYKPSYLTIKSNCSHVECVKLSNYLFFEGNTPYSQMADTREKTGA